MGTEQWGEVPEGVHMPLGKYIFNNITFSKHDPLVARFIAAGYEVIEKPYETESVLVKFPVKYENIPFVRKTVTRKNGKVEEVEINGDRPFSSWNGIGYCKRLGANRMSLTRFPMIHRKSRRSSTGFWRIGIAMWVYRSCSATILQKMRKI